MSDPGRRRDGDDVLLALLGKLDAPSCLSLQLLEAFVEGALPAGAADRVCAHLTGCLSCLNAMARVQSRLETPVPGEAYEQARATAEEVRAAPGALPRRESETGLPLIDSPFTRALLPALRRLAQLDRGRGAAPSVLIVGETGTGKGVVAQSIHALSRRATRPFVRVPCLDLPAERMEIEMFGGDAAHARAGLIERADGGTILLDGVHRVPPDVQQRLLASLEPPSGRRAVGSAPRSLDVRVIAVTNADLDDAVRRGAFRADLLQRLKPLTLTLPPLRERPDDIVPLAQHFLAQFSRERGVPLALSPAAAERLRDYLWPGNIAELVEVIRRALRHGQGQISAEALELPTA